MAYFRSESVKACLKITRIYLKLIVSTNFVNLLLKISKYSLELEKFRVLDFKSDLTNIKIPRNIRSELVPKESNTHNETFSNCYTYNEWDFIEK